MKRLIQICILICCAVNLKAQQVINTIDELENLMAKGDYHSAYKLTQQRFADLLIHGDPDTLSYYVGYLGTTSEKLNGYLTAKKEVVTALEKTKQYFPYSKYLPVTYLAAADFCSKEGDNDFAFSLMNDVLVYFKNRENIISERLSDIHNNIGTFAIRMGNNALAIKHYRESIKQFHSKNNVDLFRIYNSMGIVMYSISKIDSALFFMQAALKLLDSTDASPINQYQRRAMIQGNISNVYWELGKVDLSIQSAEQALANYKAYSQYAENANEKEKGLTGYYRSILNLGNCYQELGNYSRARELMEYSYEGKRKAFGETNSETYKSLSMLATVYFDQRDYQKAMETLKKAIVFWEKEVPSVWLAQSTACLAYTYEELHKIIEATAVYEQAYQLYKKINGDEYSLEFLRFLSKSSFFYAQNKQSAKAITIARSTVQYAIKSQGEESLTAIYQMVDLANIYLLTNNNKEALTWSRRSLAAINNLIAASGSALDSLSIEIKKPAAILAKAKAEYHLLTQKDTASIKKILYELDDAVRLLEQRKNLLTDETDVNVLLSENKDLTDFIKQLNYELFKLSDNSKYIDKILSTHEGALYTRIRSRIEKQNALRFAHIPEEVQQQEDSLKHQLKTILTEENKTNGKIASYLQAVKNWNAFQQKLKRQYPDYYRMRYAVTDISVKELSKIIPKDITVIRYLFSGDELLVLIVTKEQQTLLPLTNDSIKEKIIEMNKAVTADIVCARSFDLYKMLWEPLRKYITTKRVVVIPDEILYNISFEMLTPVTTHSYAALSQKCLLNEYTFSYHYSLPALGMRGKNTLINKNFIAFTPGFTDYEKTAYKRFAQNDSLHLDKKYLSLLPLPFTSKLAQKIKNKLGGKLFSASASTPETFKKEAGNHHIIYIGTHAESNNDYPEYSRLIFSKDHEKPTAENSVYLYDIYDCNLTSDLAVLTACESGKPGYQDGEGMISMAHAFSYAGSESILTALWKIDEQSSALITEAFYENLEAGMTKDEALQKAKRAYLQKANGRMLAPQYWAGLVIMGNLTPVKLEATHSILYYISGGILVLALLIFIGGYRKERVKNLW